MNIFTWIKRFGTVLLLLLSASLGNAQTTNPFDNVYITNSLIVGTNFYLGSTTITGTSYPGVGVNYNDPNHTVGFFSTQSNSVFVWQDNNNGTTSSAKLKLDGSNNLTLYSTNGSSNIIFNPNAGGGIQLKGTGSGITLVDGTVLSNSNSLHSSGLYNMNGTEEVSFDANGNLVIASPVALSGSGGISFGAGNTLNPNNVTYLNETLTNLGYRPTAIPADASYTLPSNFVGMYVAVDNSSNAYITGRFSGTGIIGGTTLTAVGTQDVFVVKLNPSGVVQWAESFGGSDGAGTGSTETPNGIAVDVNGNVYLVGSFSQSITTGLNNHTLTNLTGGNNEEFVVKYNPTGVVSWAAAYGGGDDWPAGIAVDENGNADVVGSYSSAMTTGLPRHLALTQGDEFLIQFSSSNGAVLWETSFGNTYDYPVGIAVDGSGNICIAGWFGIWTKIGNTGYYGNQGADEYVARFNASGSLSWAAAFGGGSDYPIGIAVDGSGNPYVTGQYYSPITTGLPSGEGLNGGGFSPSGPDEFVIKYNASSGSVSWATGFGGTLDSPQAIAVDQSGNALVTGENYATFIVGQLPPLTDVNPAGDLFMVQLNPNGVISWADDVGTSGGYVYSQSLGINPSGGLALFGFATGNFDLGNQAVNFGPFVYLGSESSLETPFSEATPNFSWGGSRASGNGAVALGTYASATSQGAVALGDGISSASYTISAGYDTTASGYGSAAFGVNNTASGSYSAAYGGNNDASGSYSTVSGNSNCATGTASAALGMSNSATGTASVALGMSNSTTGTASVALGINTTAASFASVALGERNVGLVSTNNGATAWVPTDPVLEIGNGTNMATNYYANYSTTMPVPSDALTIFKNGNLRTVGTVEAQSGVRIPQTGDMNMGSFTNGNSPTNFQSTNGLTYPGGN